MNALFPTLSIVTPSFNQAGFIEETICSVLDQNYPNLEYIIIDGGSIDGTVPIIKKYSKYLAYWVSEPDEGQPHAINKGLRMCSGILVGWQNSDDYYLPGAFMKIAQAFNTKAAEVYYGHKYNVDSQGRILRAQCYAPYSLQSNIYEGMVMANQSAFWRRELLARVGFLDENLHYALDYEYFLRLGVNRCRFSLVNDWLGCLRIHGDTKTTRFSEKWQGELRYVEQKFNIRRSRIPLNRTLYRLRRLYYYARQGNFGYIVSGTKGLLSTPRSGKLRQP